MSKALQITIDEQVAGTFTLPKQHLTIPIPEAEEADAVELFAKVFGTTPAEFEEKLEVPINIKWGFIKVDVTEPIDVTASIAIIDTTPVVPAPTSAGEPTVSEGVSAPSEPAQEPETPTEPTVGEATSAMAAEPAGDSAAANEGTSTEGAEPPPAE